LLALQSSKILKLTLFLKDVESERETANGESSESIKPNEIVKELYNIRMSIDKFLEKFERSLKISDIRLEDSTKSASTNASQTIKSNDLHKEFDPILASKNNNLNLSQNHFRSQTPETSSIASIEGSASASPSQSKQFNSLNQQQQNGTAHYAQPQSFQQQAQLPNQDQNQVSAPPLPQHQQQHQQQQPQPQFQGFNQQAPQQHQPPNPQQFNPSQFQMNPNAAVLKGPPPPPQPHHQQMPQQQFQGFQNPTDTQAHQAFYNQQQQQQQPGGMPGVMPQSFQQASGPNAGNPYSKAPNQSLARPPSTTIYQQGYK
jgi:hypothetical protein